MEEQKKQQEEILEQEPTEIVEEKTTEVVEETKTETEEPELKEEQVVENVEEQQGTEEATGEAETVEEAPEATEEVQEEVPEEKEQQETVEEGDKAEEEPEKESTETDTANEDKVEETVAEEEKAEEKVETQDELERVRVELEEAKAEIEERDAIEKFNRDSAIANSQYNDFLNKLGEAMTAEFAKYGIDANKTLEELEKEDAAKANVARGIISQAQRLKEEAAKNMTNNLNAEFNNVVFTKASRLFEKFNLTQEQAEVAAETFIGILGQSGLKDFAQDLAAKVELSVARARMIAPKVFEAIEKGVEVVGRVKEVLKDVEDAAVDVATTDIEPKEKAAEEFTANSNAVEEKPQEPVEIEEAPSVEEFMEGAANAPSAPSDSVTVDNALSKLNAIKNDKERVAFYKAHFNVIEEACRRQVDRKIK